MASPKCNSLILVLFFLLIIALSNIASVYGAHQLRPSECKGKCKHRCLATSHKKPCMFFCQKCCKKCLCVPPGTSGNKQTCSCYNNWKTKEGGPKCP